MPRLAASVLVAALVAAPGAGAAPRCARVPPGWQPHIAEARDWAKDRRGTVSFAVRTTERLYGWRTRRTVPTASVLKAMLLAAYLDRGSVRSRALRAADLRLLAPMVRRSDDVAATRVRDIVGAAGLERLAHRVGMRHFRVHRVWGHSRTDAADQTRFFLRFERYVAPRHRATALRLLRTIVESQRWGIGRLSLPGWEPAPDSLVRSRGPGPGPFGPRTRRRPGGPHGSASRRSGPTDDLGFSLHFDPHPATRGDGTGRVDHQVALLRGCGDSRVAVAVMTTGQGTHRYGKRTLEGVFRRLLRGLFAQ